ncbi:MULTISPECIES: HpcH/HpaI aldolase/citrate lyase family protein [unclassified Sphingomonas]|uniref:HpcH/HpaI aldolase/citrate lyase family protein n=1 Tax=unclassified Sphingomonas TaxID=196159 RepID=UPI00082BB3D4|nr:MULTISPECIES: CoA ester lyase [unclassified Sphingomonas]
MKLRSLLFVPGDSEKKFRRACESQADVLFLDLEDSVAPSQKHAARGTVAGWLDQAGDVAPALFVRINPFDTGLTLGDLAAVVRPGLAGLLVPKANGAEDIVRIGHYLDALEERAGMPGGAVKLMVVATETPAAMFALGSYAPAHPRLAGLTWGAEDLAAAIGATGNKGEDGDWSFPYQVARAQCLFAAASANVAPIDTLFADFRDAEGLERSCRVARRDGFVGRIAIHPDQVATINAAFSPSADEIAEARRVVDAFAAQPDAGTLGIDGKMYDIPHLKAAQRTLAAAGDPA